MSWIGVDLDGTLAEYVSDQFPLIGKPIAAMLERVKGWREQGYEVRICTARVNDVVAYAGKDIPGNIVTHEIDTQQRAVIGQWCLDYVGEKLPVTNQKDFHMIVLYDDRARQVESNTGILVGDEIVLVRHWDDLNKKA